MPPVTSTTCENQGGDHQWIVLCHGRATECRKHRDNRFKVHYQCERGTLGAINQSLVDTIDSLEPGAVVYERIPCLGFGPLSIQVTAEPENAGKPRNTQRDSYAVCSSLSREINKYFLFSPEINF